MADRSSPGDTASSADAKAIRDACISKETRKKYAGNINGIKKWIREQFSKEEPNTARFIDSTGDLNLSEFTPAFFERFLVYKRGHAKAVTLSGYRSAVKDLYRLKRLKLPVEYGDDMKQLFSGIKRLEAEQNQTSSPKTSGKQPLTFSLYKSLCKSTLKRNDSGFSHLFLTSQWNLMCRSASVQTLQTQHLLDKDDSVGAVFFKTKTNQDGSGPRDPRHLYANPFNPETCWVTALGMYLACNPRMKPGPLFPGSDPKIRFGKALGSLLKKDGSAKSYGTHSVRKGVATFACGGSTGGPSIVSVCLRCGWSLGGVQDRYFRYEAAGDQCLGRVVAGLPVNDSKFAALPPHFIDNSDDVVNAAIDSMFPGLTKETNLRGILHLCLASLVHHADFLLDNLPINHALLASVIFTSPSVLVDLRSRLENGDSKWMVATGIPPHIELYKKLDQQQKAIDALPGILEQRMEKVLEQKGVAAGNITRDLLREEIKSLLDLVGLERSQPPELSASASTLRPYYSWGGRFHKLPEDFEFPSIDPLGAWRLWWFGDDRREYPPYRSISSDDLATSKKKATLSEWSILMRHIINGIEAKLGSPMPCIRDDAHAVALFTMGYESLQLKPSKRKRRTTQLKLTTVLRLVREAETARTRTFPFKPRKRSKVASGNTSPSSSIRDQPKPPIQPQAILESAKARSTCAPQQPAHVSQSPVPPSSVSTLASVRVVQQQSPQQTAARGTHRAASPPALLQTVARGTHGAEHPPALLQMAIRVTRGEESSPGHELTPP